MSSMSGGGKGGPPDPNGMERLPGESDADYIARQTRLRDEAKARMAAKFGGGGMGGVGSGGGECCVFFIREKALMIGVERKYKSYFVFEQCETTQWHNFISL